MSEATPAAPEAPQDLSAGTSPAGQSTQSQGSQPNDPTSFQADYTRKYQALADEKKAFETQKAEFEQQRSQFQPGYSQPNTGYGQVPPQPGYGYSNVQPQPTPGYGYSQVPQQDMTHQQLVDQFGHEGAQAILAANAQSQQQLNLIRFENQYRLEELEGKRRFSDEAWSKHNYFDQNTGQWRNRVMDYRLSINPITGKALSLDDAWRLANPIDPKKIEEDVRQRTYAEITQKDQATPSQPSANATTTPNVTQPKTPGEAFRMARAQHG